MRRIVREHSSLGVGFGHAVHTDGRFGQPVGCWQPADPRARRLCHPAAEIMSCKLTPSPRFQRRNSFLSSFTDSGQHILSHPQHGHQDSLQLQRITEDAIQAAFGVETVIPHSPQPTSDRQAESFILPAYHRRRQQQSSFPYRKR